MYITSLLSCLLVYLVIGQAYLLDSDVNPFKRTLSRNPEQDAGLFEGDIRMPGNFNPRLRNAVGDKGKLWPNGIVPYTLSSRFSPSQKKLFLDAMRTIEEKTKVNGKHCIKFQTRTTEADYVLLEKYRNCWSDIGKLGTGQQTISLGRQCYAKGTVMHEMLHTLGFFHEQSRADRDRYVTVHRENILANEEKNFEKYAIGSMMSHLDQPYDYSSIMHYPENIFAKDSNKPTITAIKQGVEIGQRKELSAIDIKMIQLLYGCIRNDAEVETETGFCRDKLPNCDLYGDYACKTYPDWARTSCALTCGICKSNCSDAIQDCEAYGDRESVCQDYPQWAVKNCAKFCGIGSCEKPKQEACKDTISDCASYGTAVCTDPLYIPWAKPRCAKFCGFCTSSVDTAVVTKESMCKDKISDCVAYTSGACDYAKAWMTDNCPRFCGFCSGGSGAVVTTPTTTPKPTTTRTTTTPTTTAPTRKPTTKKKPIVSAKCEDTIDDCVDYTKSTCSSHEDWMKPRCSKFCGFCKDDSTPTCQDKNPGCDGFGKASCTNQYKPWMSDNCAKFCGLCPEKKELCADKRKDCADFGKAQCGGRFTSFMKNNCQKFCNYC